MLEVVPKSIRELEFSLVVQEIVILVEVREDSVGPDSIVGGVISDPTPVVKVLSAEVVRFPEVSLVLILKWYSVEPDKVSGRVMEWDCSVVESP